MVFTRVRGPGEPNPMVCTRVRGLGEPNPMVFTRVRGPGDQGLAQRIAGDARARPQGLGFYT